MIFTSIVERCFRFGYGSMKCYFERKRIYHRRRSGRGRNTHIYCLHHFQRTRVLSPLPNWDDVDLTKHFFFTTFATTENREKSPENTKKKTHRLLNPEKVIPLSSQFRKINNKISTAEKKDHKTFNLAIFTMRFICVILTGVGSIFIEDISCGFSLFSFSKPRHTTSIAVSSNNSKKNIYLLMT